MKKRDEYLGKIIGKFKMYVGPLVEPENPVKALVLFVY